MRSSESAVTQKIASSGLNLRQTEIIKDIEFEYLAGKRCGQVTGVLANRFSGIVTKMVISTTGEFAQ